MEMYRFQRRLGEGEGHGVAQRRRRISVLNVLRRRVLANLVMRRVRTDAMQVHKMSVTMDTWGGGDA